LLGQLLTLMLPLRFDPDSQHCGRRHGDPETVRRHDGRRDRPPAGLGQYDDAGHAAGQDEQVADGEEGGARIVVRRGHGDRERALCYRPAYPDGRRGV
jgi:hypothetical protein